MPAEFDETKATSAVQDKINKIDFDGGLDPIGEVPVASTPASEAPILEDAVDSTPNSDVGDDAVGDDAVGDDTGGEDEANSTQDGPTGEEDDKPALIDSHYRAAQRMGMSPGEISDLYDASPELAERTIAKCYEMVNAESERLGKLGIATQKAQATPAPQLQPQQPADDRVSKLIAKVKDHYDGDDPMAEVLTELLKDRQPASQPQPQQRQEPEIPQRTVDEEIASRQQINTFFADPELESYDELYGKNSSALGDWSHLTPGQRANRVETCNRAQVILYGAAAAGMEMGTAEALERAHLEVAAPMAEQIIRTRLVNSAKKRAKGVTLVPGGKRPAASATGNYDHKQAIDNVGARIKEVLG